MCAIFGNETHVMLISVDEHSYSPLWLSARIVTAESVPDAHLKRDHFYQAWWLGVPGAVDDILSYGLMWPRAA